MTHSNYTRNILNIEDENIIFEENCFKKCKCQSIFGQKCQFQSWTIMIVLYYHFLLLSNCSILSLILYELPVIFITCE